MGTPPTPRARHCDLGGHWARLWPWRPSSVGHPQWPVCALLQASAVGFQEWTGDFQVGARPWERAGRLQEKNDERLQQALVGQWAGGLQQRKATDYQEKG